MSEDQTVTALEISLMAGIIRARESGFEATAYALEDVFFLLRQETAQHPYEQGDQPQVDHTLPPILH